MLLPADKIKPTQSGKFGYTYQVVSLPLQETRLHIQTFMDTDANGGSDFQSNISCNTIKADEDIIIKERPNLVLNGTVFDAGNLLSLDGVTVTLMSAEDNTPVATSVSNIEGHYEFIDIKPGDYYIVTTPPPGYELSAHPPEYFTTFTVSDPSYGQNGFSADNTNTDSTSGVLALDPEKEAVLVDIPLDRVGIRGQIAIEKTSSSSTASLGEPVAYTVAIHNLTTQDLYASYIEDVLPPGFKYLANTAKIDGEETHDPSVSMDTGTGRTTLRFRIGDFLTGAQHTLTYIAQVTALATNSDGINTAFAHGDTITDILVTSPTASAQVTVGTDGVLSDRAIMFGRIAVEKGCAISSDQSLNETGFPLAGVRLYLEDGTYVVSDINGQYSLYGLQPGMHVLKVDNHSLPQGVEMKLVDNAQAGDPDSQFVDLKPGDYYRADFTASCPEARPEIVTRCIEPPPIVKPAAPRQVKQCVDKPVEKKVTKMVTRKVTGVIDDVHFASGKADIPPTYINKLKKLIHMTRDKQNVRFTFVGHTDNQRLKPSTKRKFGTNQGLSEARASEVAQYVLQRLNIKTRVNTAGFGETRPIASNDNLKGMAKNRRVELVMLYDEPKVTIQRSSKQVCSMKTIAPQSKLAQVIKKPLAQQTGQGAYKQRGKKICETKTLPATSPAIQNILARSKMQQSGWNNEIETIDPSNTGSLRNISRLAGKDGDISSGLVEAHRKQIKKHQTNFARSQNAKQAVAERLNKVVMPDPKMVVKTITREQGKTGVWLWPQGDTSLDGRFMAIVRSGVTPKLLVNGKEVSTKHLGEQIENKKAKAQVLAWYGIELGEGENTLTIKAKGPFGNERTLAEKVVKRPSSGVAIKMSVDGSLMADGGRSTIPVDIEILDRNGYPAKGTYFLTLENSDGMWAEPDIQDKVPGHQVKVTNGKRTVHLRSSSESGQIKLRASTGKLQSETDVAQVAELRPLIAVGLLDIRAHKGYRNGYESLGLTQLDGNTDEIEVDGRAAIFMKGRVRGNMHLTLSYDSEKDEEAELLRDIDPGEYYRVYGDSSIRGFEAQSRSPLYAKLEKDRHSLMWGDYLTDNGSSGADIARDQRTLTGANGIFDNGKTRLQFFAAQQDNMRGQEEIPGNGTAMQYRLQDAPVVKNSEVVEIITRDRANSGLIIERETLQRFRDYSIDDYTGYLTFHRVIPSLDDNLNPVTIRISYDRVEEGEEYLVAGVRLMHRLSDELNVGASYTRDEHETEGYELAGVHAEYKDEITELELGVATMRHNDGSEEGSAVRLKASRKWTEGSRTELLATQADAGYTNNSGVIADRREVKISQHQKLGKSTEGKVEFSHSESLSSEDQRQSLEVSATTQLDEWKLKGGVRQIRQTTGETEEKVNTAIIGVERGIEVFGRKGSIKAEYEREIGDADRQRASIGADMELTDKTKAYIRYEQADRLSSGTLAGSVDTRNSLVAGVKAQILPSTEMYSEYRIDGDISGEDVVAANGVKATLNLEDNLVVTPSIEFLNYMEDSDKSNSIAASVGIRDTRSADAKKLLRLETRQSGDEAYYGLNGTYVQKLNDDTTVMVQDELRFNQYDDEREDNIQNTLTIAAAHRPSKDGKYNALYAYKWETDDAANKDTHILSTHQHYRINESVDISGRLGAKQQTLNQAGVDYDSDAVMADARAQWEVTDRLSLDVHGGLLGTNGFTEKNYSAGAGVNFNVMDNLQIGAGYNIAGFVDKELDPDGRNAKGAYFGLQLKADEALFNWLSGDERPLVNKNCEPDNRVEVTDVSMLEKQRKQVAACRQARQQAAADARAKSKPVNKKH